MPTFFGYALGHPIALEDDAVVEAIIEAPSISVAREWLRMRGFADVDRGRVLTRESAIRRHFVLGELPPGRREGDVWYRVQPGRGSWTKLDGHQG